MNQLILHSILSIYLCCLFSCKQTATVPVQESIVQSNAIIPVENDTTAIVKSVRQFIHWYKEHYTMVNQVKFIEQDKSGNYQVNLTECNTYLKNLESSGFISQEYLKEWNTYFESKAIYLKENPQSEGPPEGFEFDLVLITQEPELVWNAIDSISINVTMSSNQKAIATMNGDFSYEIDLSKINGNWKIDYIATMNYD